MTIEEAKIIVTKFENENCLFYNCGEVFIEGYCDVEFLEAILLLQKSGVIIDEFVDE